MNNLLNRWREFLKIRKQNDRVKMELFFFLAGVLFIGISIYQGINFYIEMKDEAEYVLSCDDPRILTDSKIAEIEGKDYVTAVGRQMESSVELSCPWGKESFTCVKLPEKYLKKAYGISGTGSMKIFYLNQAAYGQIVQSAGNSGNKDEDISDWRLDYVLDGTKTGTARLVLITEGVSDDEPYVFCQGDSVELADKSVMIRVKVTGEDFDEAAVKQLKNIGFEFVNKEEMQIHDLNQNMGLVRIKYGILTAFLCFFSAACLQKYGK